MAEKQTFVNVNFNGNEIIDARAEKVSSLPTPTAAMAGQTVYNTTDKKFYDCNGTAWIARENPTSLAVDVVKSGDTYIVKQGGSQVGVAINVPKDMVVESGSVVTGTWSGDTFTPGTGTGTGKALALVIANGGGTVYINVADLVDVYTAGNTTTINVSIDNANKITATVNNKSIGIGHLTDAALTQLQSATITAPVASSVQATAGTKTIASLFQTVVNNIKQLFTTMDTKVDKVAGKGLSTNDYTDDDKNKLANIKGCFTFQSAALVGTTGSVEVSGVDSSLPVIMQAQMAGEEIGIQMTWNSSAKSVDWASNKAFVAGDNVKIIVMQQTA